jgi:hypothetical protein
LSGSIHVKVQPFRIDDHHLKRIKQRNNILSHMKIVKQLIATVIFILAFSALNAQQPPHPNSGNNPGAGNTPVGGTAPIGSGLVILLALGAGYGTKKVYDARKKLME